MKRREFLSGLGATAAGSYLVGGTMPVLAQAPNRVHRLGYLANSALSEGFDRQITLPELSKLGFAEGRNLDFDVRVGQQPESLPGLMGQLLTARPDVIVAVGPAAIVAAAAATRTVPIVTFGANIVELGLAKSYARPTGNVTGIVILNDELEPKRLSILREAVPDRHRVAALITAAAGGKLSEAKMMQASSGLGVELLPFTVTSPADYPAAFAAMQAAGAQALVISATSEFFRDGRQLAALALEAHLPTVCEWAEMARTGCLIGYGPDRAALRRRMAAQIALIFGGTAPGDVAIEQPSVFEMAVNQKIAKSLDLTIPLSVLAQADEVID